MRRLPPVARFLDRIYEGTLIPASPQQAHGTHAPGFLVMSGTAVLGSPSRAGEPLPSVSTYTVFINGIQAHALADTGAAVNVVSAAFVERNRNASWSIFRHKSELAMGGARTVKSPGYIRADLNFFGCRQLYHIELYIVDGHNYDIALGHNFLRQTGTIEFTRPGAIVKTGFSTVGPTGPFANVVLSTLIAVKKEGIIAKIIRRCRRGKKQQQAVATTANVLEDMEARKGEIEDRNRRGIVSASPQFNVYTDLGGQQT